MGFYSYGDHNDDNNYNDYRGSYDSTIRTNGLGQYINRRRNQFRIFREDSVFAELLLEVQLSQKALSCSILSFMRKDERSRCWCEMAPYPQT